MTSLTFFGAHVKYFRFDSLNACSKEQPPYKKSMPFRKKAIIHFGPEVEMLPFVRIFAQRNGQYSGKCEPISEISIRTFLLDSRLILVSHAARFSVLFIVKYLVLYSRLS